MKVKHVSSQNIWLVSKGDQLLCKSRVNPWKSQRILALALGRETPATRASAIIGGEAEIHFPGTRQQELGNPVI